ncbi:MAG: hypothetical protein JNK82_28765 [Myxococcaceae bacterium]|nr:hypothetical protein [Myxococcaceae bacterium]
MRRRVLIVAAALTLTGCHNFRDDLIIICDAPDKIDVPADAKPAARLQAIGAYLDANVKTKEGRELMYAVGGANRSQRSKVLRGLATKYGIMTCHLADTN